MKRLFSLFMFLIPLPLFAQGNPAQNFSFPPLRMQDVKAHANQLLRASDEATQAWGAYLVSHQKLTAFEEALVANLDRVTNQPATDRRLLNAIFDALIQIDAEVAGEKLMPHYTEFPNQVLILLSKSPAKNQKVFLSLLTKPNLQTGWFVICNALVQTKAPGFAKILLQELEIEANVFVTSAPNQGYGAGGGGGCGGWACLGAGKPAPTSFPPQAYYSITRQAERNVVAFSPGKFPVFYVRTEEGNSMNRGFNSSDCLSELERDNHRREYLAELLNTTTNQLQFQREANVTLLWKGQLNYKLKLAGIRKELTNSFWQFARRFQDANLLTETEMAELTPKIKLKIHDLRTGTNAPLPD